MVFTSKVSTVACRINSECTFDEMNSRLISVGAGHINAGYVFSTHTDSLLYCQDTAEDTTTKIDEHCGFPLLESAGRP